MLAAALRLHQDALRADLQRYYGIDLDHAMGGEHTAGHIAALVAYLPQDCALYAARDKDAAWTLEAVLLADISNKLGALIYGMSDPRKRGARPKPIGPSWMTKSNMRTLEARVLTVDELEAELAKPRTSKAVM